MTLTARAAHLAVSAHDEDEPVGSPMDVNSSIDDDAVLLLTLACRNADENRLWTDKLREAITDMYQHKVIFTSICCFPSQLLK